jgi:hypothetical protein
MDKFQKSHSSAQINRLFYSQDVTVTATQRQVLVTGYSGLMSTPPEKVLAKYLNKRHCPVLSGRAQFSFHYHHVTLHYIMHEVEKLPTLISDLARMHHPCIEMLT